MNVIKLISMLAVCMGLTIFFGMIYSVGIIWMYLKSNLPYPKKSDSINIHY